MKVKKKWQVFLSALVPVFIMIAVLAFSFFVSYKIISTVQRVGLKTIVESVWEGES